MHYSGDFRKSCEKVFSPPSKLNKLKTFSTQNWFNDVSLCWYNQSAWLAVDVHELCWLLYHKDTLTFEIPAKVSLPYCCCIDETVLHNQLHSSFLLLPPPSPLHYGHQLTITKELIVVLVIGAMHYALHGDSHLWVRRKH